MGVGQGCYICKLICGPGTSFYAIDNGEIRGRPLLLILAMPMSTMALKSDKQTIKPEIQQKSDWIM